MLVSYATGLIGMALLVLLWAGVQAAWRRSFPDASGDPDALAGRLGCHGCAERDGCERSAGAGRPQEGDRR